jgi:hypothetical protein
MLDKDKTTKASKDFLLRTQKMLDKTHQSPSGSNFASCTRRESVINRTFDESRPSKPLMKTFEPNKTFVNRVNTTDYFKIDGNLNSTLQARREEPEFSFQNGSSESHSLERYSKGLSRDDSAYMNIPSLEKT